MLRVKRDLGSMPYIFSAQLKLFFQNGAICCQAPGPHSCTHDLDFFCLPLFIICLPIPCFLYIPHNFCLHPHTHCLPTLFYQKQSAFVQPERMYVTAEERTLSVKGRNCRIGQEDKSLWKQTKVGEGLENFF